MFWKKHRPRCFWRCSKKAETSCSRCILAMFLLTILNELKNCSKFFEICDKLWQQCVFSNNLLTKILAWQAKLYQRGINMTRNQIILTKESGRVTKILTASRILQISIALCQIKAKIHSFPTMYIIGGGKFGLTRWKKCLKPKRSPKNSCFGGNESQLHNFGRVWDPNFLRWPQFGGYPRKATCLSFKMSYVQGP